MGFGLDSGTGGSFMDKQKSFSGQGISAMNAAKSGYTQTTEAPGKTAGGAISSAVGMGLAGAEIGAMISTSAAAGPWGLAAGAALGMMSYFMS